MATTVKEQTIDYSSIPPPPPFPLPFQNEPYQDEIDQEVDDNDSVHSGLLSPRLARAPRRRRLSGVTAARLVTLIENKAYSFVSLERALKTWKPKNDDVVLLGSGIAGESIVTRMIRSLDSAKAGTVFPDKMTAPLVESSAYDDEEGSKVLNASIQASFHRRLFRTALTYRAMDDRQLLSSDEDHNGVKFVVLARNPVDTRLAWYAKTRRDYVTEMCETEEEAEDELEYFDQKYSADDFAHNPGTHLYGNTCLKEEEEAYESNMADWVSHVARLEAAESKSKNDSQHINKNVLILLMEEVLAKPDRVMEKLAAHLGYDAKLLTPGLMESVSGTALLTSTSCMEELTRDQRRFIKLRFLPWEEGGYEVSPLSHSGRLAFGMKMKMMAATNVSNRGIFVSEGPARSADFSRKSLHLSASSSPRLRRQSESSTSIHVENQVLSPRVVGDLKTLWSKLNKCRNGSMGSSYEALYRKLTGDEYPYADPTEASSSSSSMETTDNMISQRRSSRGMSLLSPLTSSFKKLVVSTTRRTRTDSKSSEVNELRTASSYRMSSDSVSSISSPLSHLGKRASTARR